MAAMEDVGGATGVWKKSMTQPNQPTGCRRVSHGIRELRPPENKMDDMKVEQECLVRPEYDRNEDGCQ